MEPRRWWTTALPIAAVLLALIGLAVFAAVLFWPDGDGDDDVATQTTESTDDSSDDRTDTTKDREPQVSPSATTTTTAPPPTTAPVALDLLGGGFPVALQDLLAAAGQPGQLYELSIYDGYAFLAYRDPADPTIIDRREWRAGDVGDAGANPAADRVDERTEPKLFAPTELDPTVVAHLVADAPLQYDIPVTVSHVIIDRFLPFDERVLIRVYTVPTDGRSGGGYVSYDTAGALVRVCC